MYRVAEFYKKRGKQVFSGFGQEGYLLEAKGRLFYGNIEMNLNDKRKGKYREINYFTGRYDLGGVGLYDKDIIYNKTTEQFGYIKYLPYKAAFLMMLKNGKIEVPYSFLDCYSISLIKVGNLYENKILLFYKK